MKKGLKIFGERNSNTTYLSRILALNLSVDLLRSELGRPLNYYKSRYPGGELLRDAFFHFSSRANLGWKHARVDTAYLNRTGALNGRICFVTVSKNPYAWLLSLYERPYHQHHTKSMTFEEFLVHPWKLVRRDNCPGAFLNSPMTLWNIKNQSYLSLEGPHCLATSSEQLLENPARVIDSIATAFQVPKVSESFVNFEESTNVAGKTYSDYRDYYLEEKWKRLLTPESIRVINGQLDAGLVESLGYKLLEPFESQDSVPLNSR